MNEVKKVILFLLCCAIPFSFYAQKARQNAVTKKWGYEQTENKGWWENSKYRGNSMFGGWDAALVNQDYEINWLISPQYEGVTKRFTEKLAGVVLGGKVGFIDIHNRFIIKPQFENADDIHGFNYKPQNKMFRFYKTFCSRITLINTNQNVILNPI